MRRNMNWAALWRHVIAVIVIAGNVAPFLLYFRFTVAVGNFKRIDVQVVTLPLQDHRRRVLVRAHFLGLGPVYR